MKPLIDRETGELRQVLIRTPYNYDKRAASDAAGLACMEPTRTQQQFRDDANINTIVRKFGLTGQLPTNLRTPLQGDFTEVTDFQTAMNITIDARNAFMQLPAEIRKRFGNDPGQFLDFVYDDKNRDEAKKMGILVPDQAPQGPIEVRVVPEPSADA